MIRAQPLTGIGTGNFKALSGKLGGVAHNTYIEIAAELGIPGLALFGAILFFDRSDPCACPTGHARFWPRTHLPRREAIQVGPSGRVSLLSFSSQHRLRSFSG